MKDERRPDPEVFLGLDEQAKRGRLKVYLGGAAGVGKTYRMLQEAHQLQGQMRDVVLGLIETHQRAETAALLEGLESIAPCRIPYRGVILEEMDLDALLARKPEFAIVDELAHSNPADSRHHKRHQDVEELLAAGINVVTAFNIQHLESLSQMVRHITGVEIRETIPDTFLARADQVVTVDLSIEELRQRLREGKIYPPEQVEAALKNFFKPSNLAALRELALREVARDQSRQREALLLLKREGGRQTSLGDRLMVCLSSNPRGSDELLRKAAHTAAYLNADWNAVHVETPAESVRKISTADFRALLDNINLAADLGADVVWLKSPDVVSTLVEFAREKKVSRIMIGRARPGLWTRILRPSIMQRLLREARDFDIEIVAQEISKS